MARVNITIDLPDDIEQQARDAGLFTNEKIFDLIEAELERRSSWNRLFGMMKQLQAATEADFGDMTEGEFIDMVNEIVHEVRVQPQPNAQGEKA